MQGAASLPQRQAASCRQNEEQNCTKRASRAALQAPHRSQKRQGGVHGMLSSAAQKPEKAGRRAWHALCPARTCAAARSAAASAPPPPLCSGERMETMKRCWVEVVVVEWEACDLHGL